AHAHGRIDRDFLASHVTNLDQYFYVCGPPEMTDNIIELLAQMGVEKSKIITEDMD
ncbi:hypothetical protein LCGC14_0974670, partial [marine sediment metagenome]